MFSKAKSESFIYTLRNENVHSEKKKFHSKNCSAYFCPQFSVRLN